MEVEFHGGVGGVVVWMVAVVVVCKPIFMSIPTQLSYIEMKLT